MTARADLPRLDDLPIPADVRPGAGWTNQMLELSAHIGAHATLTIVAACGGQRIGVPVDPAASPFAELVGPSAAAKIAWLYGGHRIELPVAKAAVARARRGGVLASVRARKLTVGEAAAIIGTSRTYVHQLLGDDRERLDAPPLPTRLLTRVDPRQLTLFGPENDQD